MEFRKLTARATWRRQWNRNGEDTTHDRRSDVRTGSGGMLTGRIADDTDRVRRWRIRDLGRLRIGFRGLIPVDNHHRTEGDDHRRRRPLSRR